MYVVGQQFTGEPIRLKKSRVFKDAGRQYLMRIADLAHG